MGKKAVYKLMRQLEEAGTTGHRYKEIKKKFNSLSPKAKKYAISVIERELKEAEQKKAEDAHLAANKRTHGAGTHRN